MLPGTLAEAEVAPHAASVKELLVNAGGKDVEIREQGKNRLAYPIKHIRYGYFVLGHLKIDSEAIPMLEKKLRLVDNMLRVLIRRTPENAPDSIAFAGMSAAPRDREEDEETQTREREVTAPVEVQKEEPKKTKVIEAKAETKAEDVNVSDITMKLNKLLEDDITGV